MIFLDFPILLITVDVDVGVAVDLGIYSAGYVIESMSGFNPTIGWRF